MPQLPPSDSETTLSPRRNEYRDDATSTAGSDVTAINNPALQDYERAEELITPPQAPKQVPKSVQRVINSVATWIKGPQPPRPYKIRPFFPAVQNAPVRLLDRYLPKRRQKIWLLVAFYVVWLLSFSLVLRRSAFSTEIAGYGSPVRVSCSSRVW